MSCALRSNENGCEAPLVSFIDCVVLCPAVPRRMTAAGEMESEPPPAAEVMATARMSVAIDRTRIVELLMLARLLPELLSTYVPGDGGGDRSGGDGVADFDFQGVKGDRADCGVGVDDHWRFREQLAVEPHRCAAVRRFEMRGD